MFYYLHEVIFEVNEKLKSNSSQRPEWLGVLKDVMKNNTEKKPLSRGEGKIKPAIHHHPSHP